MDPLARALTGIRTRGNPERLVSERVPLTAEEAMKKVRKGEKLTGEELDGMRVDENIKFLKMLVEEGRVSSKMEIAIMGMESYLKAGIISPEDTVEEAQKKIDRYIAFQIIGAG